MTNAQIWDYAKDQNNWTVHLGKLYIIYISKIIIIIYISICCFLKKDYMWAYSNFPKFKVLNTIFFYDSMKRDKGFLDINLLPI